MKIEGELGTPIHLHDEAGAYLTDESVFVRDAANGSLRPVQGGDGIVLCAVKQWDRLYKGSREGPAMTEARLVTRWDPDNPPPPQKGRERLAAILHEWAIGCWYDSHSVRYCEPDYEHHAKHADRLIVSAALPAAAPAEDTDIAGSRLGSTTSTSVEGSSLPETQARALEPRDAAPARIAAAPAEGLRLLGRLLERQIIVRDSYGRPSECRACGQGIDTHHRHAAWCDVPDAMRLLGWPIPEPEPPSAAATARLPFDVGAALARHESAGASTRDKDAAQAMADDMGRGADD